MPRRRVASTKGMFIHQTGWKPGDYDLIDKLREIRAEMESGRPGCELVDELDEVARLAARHPNPDVADVARRILAELRP